MSYVKINNKKYEVPELSFRHLTMIERGGLTLRDMMTNKYMFTTAEVFTAIVVDCSLEQADYLLEQHILGGGTISPIYDAFLDAMRDSSFFKTLLERQQKKEAKTETKTETENEASPK